MRKRICECFQLVGFSLSRVLRSSTWSLMFHVHSHSLFFPQFLSFLRFLFTNTIELLFFALKTSYAVCFSCEYFEANGKTNFLCVFFHNHFYFSANFFHFVRTNTEACFDSSLGHVIIEKEPAHQWKANWSMKLQNID